MNFLTVSILFSILPILICQPEFRLVQDEGYFEVNDFIDYLNEQRRNISSQNLFELTLDKSLVAMAHRAMKTCDEEGQEVEEFSKTRFQLSMNLERSAFSVDLFDSNSTYLDNLLHPEHTRIGCSLKVCTYPPGYRIFNQLCFLGSRGSKAHESPCQGLCKEAPASQTLQKDILSLLNSRRRAFAESVSAGNMYKMSWNTTLTTKAQKIAHLCGATINQTHFEEAILFEPELLPIAPFEQGKDVGEKYLLSSQKAISKDTELYIPYRWNHTKVGCVHAPKPCGKVICVVGTGSLDGPVVKKGKLCSLCDGQCEDGLCLGEPRKEEGGGERNEKGKEMWWLMLVVELLVFIYFYD